MRARSAIASALVVALALLGSGAAMGYLTQRSLISSLRVDQFALLSGVVDLVARDGNPDSLDRTLQQKAPPGTILQVVQGDRVEATSTWWADQRPITGLRPGPGVWSSERTGVFKLADRTRPYLITAAGVEHLNTPYTVIVATSFAGEQASLEQLLHLVAVGFPLLVLLIGVGTWYLVGRALRPVEEIRSQVAVIEAGRLGERVPVPQTTDEIASLAVTMNQMLDRLQAAHQAQRQFVADASHELRSPLATLAASLDVARSDLGADAWRELAGLMSFEVDRMSSLVDNLLLLARADDQALHRRQDDVDLDDVLGREVARQRAAGRLPLAAVIRPVRVRGDELQLSQVVRNLVDNAVRHAEARVEVRLEEEGAFAVLTVQDDGPGIPEGQRQRVFERFVRLDESRDRASGGSGLGLAIVAEVVAAHGGTVEIGSALGGGARVVVRLPAPLAGSFDTEVPGAAAAPVPPDDAAPLPTPPARPAQPPSVSSR